MTRAYLARLVRQLSPEARKQSVAPRWWIVDRLRDKLAQSDVRKEDWLIFVMNHYRENEQGI